MKPSTSRSALIGAVIVSGGWLSLPSVAFAAEAPARAAGAPAEQRAGSAAIEKAPHAGCPADAHTHAASCTCAHCAAARAE